MPNTCYNTNSNQSANVTSYEVTKAIYTSGLFNKVKLSPTTKLVLIALSNHYNPNKKDMFPSLMYLANQLGISHSSVARAITELKNKGLIIYTTTKVNHYKFTSIFFELINLNNQSCQNEHKHHVKKTCKQIKEQKKNNNSFSNFSKNQSNPIHLNTFKNSKYEYNNQNQGIKYQKYQPHTLKAETPLDLSKKQAIEYLNNLMPELKNCYFAKKIREKWNL